MALRALLVLVVLCTALPSRAQPARPAFRDAAWASDAGWGVRTTVIGRPSLDDPEAARRIVRVARPAACASLLVESEVVLDAPAPADPQAMDRRAADRQHDAQQNEDNLTGDRRTGDRVHLSDLLAMGSASCLGFGITYRGGDALLALVRTQDGRRLWGHRIATERYQGREWNPPVVSGETMYVLIGLERYPTSLGRLLGVTAAGKVAFDRQDSFQLPVAAGPDASLYITLDAPRDPSRGAPPPLAEIARILPTGQDAWRRSLPRTFHVTALTASGTAVVAGGAGIEAPDPTGRTWQPRPTGRLVALGEDGALMWDLDVPEQIDVAFPDGSGGIYTVGRSGPGTERTLGAVDVWIRHVGATGVVDRVSRGAFPEGIGVEVASATRDGDSLVVTVGFGGFPHPYETRGPVGLLMDESLVVEFALRAVGGESGEAGVPAGPPEALTIQARPNPVRAGSPLRLAVGVPEAGDVTIEVFDMQGRRIIAVDRPGQAAGTFEASIPSELLAAGSYLVRVDVGRGRSWSVARLTVVR